MKRMIALFSILACLVVALCPAAMAESALALTASASAQVVEPGESFTVQVNLSGNPGLFGLAVEVEFDDTVMRLSGAKNGQVFTSEMTGPYTDKSGARMAWYDLSNNNTNNGCLVTLTFTALDVVSPGETRIKVKVNEGDAVNWDLEEFEVAPGTASVKMHGEIEWVTTKEATCTEDGSREQICSGCKAVLAAETIPAPGHSWDEGEVTKEPACAEAGEKTYTCTVCGETKTETIPAPGHSWDEGEVTKEPACAEAGEKTYTCTVCGETKTETIPALGHSWGEWETVTEPAVGSEGQRQRTCAVCGEVETESIPALEPEATPAPAEPTPAPAESAPAAAGSTSPKTGDDAPVAIYMGLALSALAGAAALRRRRIF